MHRSSITMVDTYSTMSMTTEEWVYLTLLLFSTWYGTFMRHIKCQKTKKLCCTVAGLLILFAISGFHIIHPFILTFFNAFIVLNVHKKSCHIISFIFCFSYLMFVRLCEYFNIPSPPEMTYTVLMIMVLKMVGLAYEMNMHYLKTTMKDDNDKLKEVYMHVQPTFCDIIQYSFCYAGLLVGPYYKFRTYIDIFEKPYSTRPHSTFLRRRILIVPVYTLLYLLSEYFFPLSIASSEEIWKYPFLYRVFYVWPWFFSFRMRIYVAFVLGECICINLGLGCYPSKSEPKPGAGPTNLPALNEIEKNLITPLPFDFETIRCMDELKSEFRPTMREGIRYWNMTVQYWLAIFIYKKTPGGKPLKMTATMFVSAIWHGVRPGYYLSLLSTPLILLSEMQFENAFRKSISKSNRKIYDFFWYFVKMQLISYCGIAFVLLDFNHILHYWQSIYYCGHIFTLILFMAAFVKSNFFRHSHEKNDGLNSEHKAKVS